MLLGLPKFEYIACETIQEACSMLSEYQGQAKFVAGVTDLLVKMKHRRILPLSPLSLLHVLLECFHFRTILFLILSAVPGQPWWLL